MSDPGERKKAGGEEWIMDTKNAEFLVHVRICSPLSLYLS